MVNLPQKLVEINSDDIFLAYNCLGMVLPFVRELDRGILQQVIIESNLVQDLIDRSSANEDDPTIRMTCTTLLIDIFYDEATVLSNLNYGNSDIY